MSNPLIPFLSLPPEGIMVLVNEVDKKFYLMNSSNCTRTLYDLTLNLRDSSDGRYRNLKEDLPKLELKILSDKRDKYKFNDYLNEYRNSGYTDYLERKGYFKYYGHKIIMKEVSRSNYVFGAIVACLYLLNSNRRPQELIAVFNTYKEAEDWFRAAYPDGVVGTIKIADNKLTRRCRKYIEENKERRKGYVIKAEELRVLAESDSERSEETT